MARLGAKLSWLRAVRERFLTVGKFKRKQSISRQPLKNYSTRFGIVEGTPKMLIYFV